MELLEEDMELLTRYEDFKKQKIISIPKYGSLNEGQAIFTIEEIMRLSLLIKKDNL